MATGTLTAVNDTVSASAGTAALFTIATGAQPGTVVFEVNDGTNWLKVNYTRIDGSTILVPGAVPNIAAIPVNVVQGFIVQTPGAVTVRVRTTTGFNGVAANVVLLVVTSSGGGGGGLSVIDAAAWTAGTSAFTPSGGVYNDSAAALTSGQQGTERLTPNRAAHVNLRSNGGAEITSANPLQVALATGLSLANDTVGAVPQAGATGGASAKRIISANSTNGTLVKASAGTLYSVRVTNFDTAAAAFVKLYNETTNPPVVGTDTVFDTIYCPAAVSATQGSTVLFSGPSVGVAMATGIGFGITQLLADADTTAVGLNKVLVTLIYN